MMTKKSEDAMSVKTRTEVEKQDCWNVEAMYANFSDWEKELKELGGKGKPHWPELAAFRGKLREGPIGLKQLLDLLFALSRRLSKVYTYAHLRHDEDITNDRNKVAFNQAMGLYHDFAEETAWIEPELLAIPDAKMEKFLKDPILTDYRFYIEKAIRVKKHSLSEEKEELLALGGKALQVSQKAFSAINDADFQFGFALDNQGKEHPLSHALYGIFVRERDRTLRESAFKKMHGKYLRYENTMCELLNGQVQSHWFNARARSFESCLDAALFPKNIDTGVYRSLIKAVNENLQPLHRYIKLRGKVLGIESMHLYDMSVPLTSEIDIKMSYKEAEEAVVNAVAPLGSEYQNMLRKGLLDQRWVDRYENKNKRSGAYSSGCYDSMPYILMNFKGLLRDVFTLAHEAGHSMHSLLSHKNQPYQYGDYPIFLAEVASTFNEELLMRYLLERCKNKEEKIFLINQKIEDLRATFFRQTMFAEFELFIHEMAEKNIPLTPKLLKDEYRKLNERYFGPSVIIDTEADAEWARIPHFYYNFYVFQYATGISAALALADRVTQGGNKEREEYLSFLKAGSSRYPIDILKSAGVDMHSAGPVNATIKRFDALVGQLETLMG